MELRRYNPVAKYILGKVLLVSDALSRNPMQQTHSTTEEDVIVYINSIVKNRSATIRKLKEISNATSMEPYLQEVIHLTLNGWLRKEDRLNRGVKPYFTHRNDLSVHKNSIFPRSDSDSTKSQSGNATINTYWTSWIKQMSRMRKNVSMAAKNIARN